MAKCKYPNEVCANMTILNGSVYCDSIPCSLKNELPKQTNADRIRNMSDEELAEFLDDLTDNCCRCAEHQNCGNCQIGLDEKTGFCDIEKWLKSEVKGSDV